VSVADGPFECLFPDVSRIIRPWVPSSAAIAGVGQAEGFKFGPVVGEYVAMRVLGNPGDPELVKAFQRPTDEYKTTAPFDFAP
jgi:hypothetical protein